MEVLKIESLSKSFGGVAAVNGVSFTVESGERLAIIGPNGAGKTTLFNLINGQLSATSGRIFFFGEDVTSVPTYRRIHLGQGRIFQMISLLQELSILENVLLAFHGTKPSLLKMFRLLKGFDEEFQRASQILKALDLWERREHKAKNLSYGEQRKLEISLGMAAEPRLLLLDEPSAGLTKEESLDVIGIIKNLGSKITVLIVDHDMDMVFEVAERITVLHYGQIIADGTPEKIQADPKVKEIYMGFDESTQFVTPN